MAGTTEELQKDSDLQQCAGCLRLAHAPSQEILALRSLGAMSLSEGDAQSFCDVRGRPDLVAFIVLKRNAYG